VTLAILAGCLLLYAGAEALVRGGVGLATRAGVSPLVVGLTVVAYGTSMPELVVSVTAGLGGHGDVAVGNVIGSNIFNIAAILGLSALVRPIAVHVKVVRREVLLMLVATLVALALLSDGRVGRVEGLALCAGIVAYAALSIVWGRRERGDAAAVTPGPTTRVATALALIVGGLAALVLGSRLFTTGAIELARRLGVGEAVIGLTVVSAGTSLPELATSVVAAARRQADIAVGNIVGSNVFNLLCILGVAATVTPLRAPGIRALDLAAVSVVSVIVLPLMRSGFRVRRWEGALLLALYAGYLIARWPSK
jgi:cation:H+ antiporter